RSMQITEVEKFVKELIVSVCELGKAFGLYSGQIPDFQAIGIDFDDGAFQDKNAQLNYYMKLVNLGYPVDEVFAKLLDLPEEEATALYQKGMRQKVGETTRLFDNEELEE